MADDQQETLAEVADAYRQVDSGHYIRHDDIKSWLLSWGTEHELPPPQCSCGKPHEADDQRRTTNEERPR